jgi:hypothetical protein
MRKRCRNRHCCLSFRTYDRNEWYCCSGCRGIATREANAAARAEAERVDADDDPDRPVEDPTVEEIWELAKRIRPPGRRPTGPRFSILREHSITTGGPRARYGRLN